MNAPESDNRDWLDHPEVSAAFEVALTDLLVESDRGAALIAADMISNQLDDTFKRLAPSFLRPKLQQMMSYPGVASSLSGKADIAALNGWIDEATHRAIGHMRRIRNDAAHSNRNFQLKTQSERLNEMLSLGDNIPTAVHNMAVEILIRNLFHTLQKNGEELIGQLGENPFGTFEKIAEQLQARPDWSVPLEERLPRLKLGLGVCLIIWLMTLQRERTENQRAGKPA